MQTIQKELKVNRMQIQSFMEFAFPPGKLMNKEDKQDWINHYNEMRKRHRIIGNPDLATACRIFKNHIKREV